MSALEIKPGKYRTRDGWMAEVTGGPVIMGDGKTYDVSGLVGPLRVPTAWMANGATWHPSHRIGEHGNDLIERIEDEPKAEDSVRRYITDAAWQNIVKKRGYGEEAMALSEKAQRAEGNVVVAAEEFDLIVAAARVVDTANTYAKEACGIVGNAQAALDEAKQRITRLEAENESLSRQLRSRAINAEPASSGKVWRWSPLV